MEAKRGRGRPRIGEQVSVSMPAELMEALKQDSEDTGLTISDLVRHCVNSTTHDYSYRIFTRSMKKERIKKMVVEHSLEQHFYSKYFRGVPETLAAVELQVLHGKTVNEAFLDVYIELVGKKSGVGE